MDVLHVYVFCAYFNYTKNPFRSKFMSVYIPKMRGEVGKRGEGNPEEGGRRQGWGGERKKYGRREKSNSWGYFGYLKGKKCILRNVRNYSHYY